MGLVAAATSIGIAQAQDDTAGTVQLGPQAQAPAAGTASTQSSPPVFAQSDVPAPPGFLQIPPSPGPGSGAVGPNSPGYGNYFQLTPVESLFTPRVTIDSRGGGLYGYNAGYSNIGMLLPYKVDDNTVLFASGLGLVTYDGRGGATGGVGWRFYDERTNRIVGLSGWYDYDNGHAQAYQQLGLSLESLGQYVDYRLNGYLPVSKADHVLSTNLTSQSILLGSGIGILRNNTIEQSYSGFDAEMGGPTPFLGRYGLNAYIGGYYFMGNGLHSGNFTGVSGRLLSQINEDVSFGVQVTNDSAFGLNTQFQVFVNMPNGKPSKWLRNLRVRDRLVQNVFRQNRVVAKTDTFNTFDVAINPTTHLPFLVANIDPNLTANGNGSANSPFNSIGAYESLTTAQRQHYDIILVRPRTDATTTNLDTGANAGSLFIYNGQRLLSTTTTQTIFAENGGGMTLSVPGFTGGANPMIFNSTGGNVVTLVGGNTVGQQVSGFEIIGSATGNGIFGNNNLATNISQNDIHGGLNGALFTNLSGTIAAGTEALFINNNIHDNVGNGIQVTNNGSPPFVNPLDVIVQNNTLKSNGFSGLRLDAQAGATIGGVIGGTNTAATSTSPAVNLSNTFDSNGTNGLTLTANGGILDFASGPVAATSTTFAKPSFGIFNNTFTSNVQDGLHIDTTNSSISSFNIINNKFGTSAGASTGNGRFGIGLVTDSGTTSILIGGDIVTNTDGTTFNPGNTFNFNAVSAIDFAASGTAALTYDIVNNTITNGVSATIAPPHDAFTFTFDGTSGTDPFIITNLSDPGITISSVTWNLAGTPATIAATPLATNPSVLQPISDTLLTSLNGNAVIPGSSPLLISALNARASNANSGLAAGSQILPMGFTNFVPSAKFQATARFEQAGGSAPLTSASTAGSSVTVVFSNGLTSTQKVAAVASADGLAVGASGEAFGTSTPGFGTGVDGIHVMSAGSSTVTASHIVNNSISGYGSFGVHLETAGTSQANVLVEHNTIQSNGTGVNGAGVNVFSGGGVQLARHDSSSLNVLIDNNTVTSNFNTGLALVADGTAAGGLTVNSHDNAYSNNAGNGLVVNSGGAAVITFNSTRDNFSGNGGGSAKNVAVTGGDDMAIFTSGTSVTNLNLINVLANSSNGNGLSATTGGTSILNLVVDTVNDSTFTGQSSFSNNKQNGILLTSNEQSYMHANIFNSVLNNNVLNGISFARNGTSLVRSSIVNTNLSNNSTNGLLFHGLGSDPQNPNQQLSGTPNRIILINDSLTFNGNFTNGINGAGQGARIDLLGDSELVLDASASNFSNNAQNGLRVLIGPGAEFGYEAGNERSVLDNNAFNNNALNGIMVTSIVTPQTSSPTGVINPFFPADAPSVTFMQISSNTGNTTINNNGLHGINLQYVGGNHDVLVTGDTNPALPNFATVIQGNGGDGIHSEVADDTSGNGQPPGTAITTVTLSLDRVLIGGPLAANANARNGIDFEAQSVVQVKDDNNTVTNFVFPEAGSGILNVTNSTIQGNGLNGINLLGNDLAFNGFNGDGTFADRTSNNPLTDGFGRLQANISNSNIISNKGTGVNIDLRGQMGEFRDNSAFGQNNFVLTNNTISGNGAFGVFMQQNTGVIPFRSILFNDLQPTNPAAPFDPLSLIGLFGWNTGDNTDLRNGFLLSNFLDLTTSQASSLVMVGNTIQHNGAASNLNAADGVYIRVGTGTYLSADIRNNVVTGNLASDFHFESFDSYNPVTGVAPQPTGSVARGAPALDTVVLDTTAQLDLRFTGNIGNTINVTDPLVNFTANGTLPGNTTPNGAVWGADPLKDNFSFTNPSPRLVQLFEVDDGFNLNSLNNFTQNGVTTDLQSTFFNSNWHLRTIADPAFPNPAFPQDFFASPGNPFLP